MSGMTRPDPLKAIGQLHLERAGIAPRPPLQCSFNAASLSPYPHFLPTPFRLRHHRLPAGIGLILSRYFQIDDDWLAGFTIDHFAAFHSI